MQDMSSFLLTLCITNHELRPFKIIRLKKNNKSGVLLICFLSSGVLTLKSSGVLQAWYVLFKRRKLRFVCNPELKSGFKKTKRNKHNHSLEGPVMKTMRVLSQHWAPITPLVCFTCISAYLYLLYNFINSDGKYPRIYRMFWTNSCVSFHVFAFHDSSTDEPSSSVIVLWEKWKYKLPLLAYSY